MMKRIRPASKIYAGFNGYIGIVKFVDGVSEETLPQHLIDRISAAVPMIEIDEDGNEAHAGSAARIVIDSATRATIAPDFSRQTEEEKRLEEIERKKKAMVAPATRFYSLDELTEVAAKHGINGVRAISDLWGIKSRKIADLVKGILDAQGAFTAARDGKLQQIADEVAKVTEDEDKTVEGIEDKPEDELEIQDVNRAMAKAVSADDILLGSSLLASTYDIGGETVQLGAIVRGAFTTFGGTAEAWNALADDAREDLLRLELDRRLAAE